MCVCFHIGAWEWEFLEEALAEKLKNPLAVAQLMDRIRSFVGREKVTGVDLLKQICEQLWGVILRFHHCIVHYSMLGYKSVILHFLVKSIIASFCTEENNTAVFGSTSDQIV